MLKTSFMINEYWHCNCFRCSRSQHYETQKGQYRKLVLQLVSHPVNKIRHHSYNAVLQNVKVCLEVTITWVHLLTRGHITRCFERKTSGHFKVYFLLFIYFQCTISRTSRDFTLTYITSLPIAIKSLKIYFIQCSL